MRSMFKLLILLLTLLVFSNHPSAADNCDEFNEAYSNWVAWRDNDPLKDVRSSSMPGGPYWVSIIEMGPKILPCIVPNITNNEGFVELFMQITGISWNNQSLVLIVNEGTGEAIPMNTIIENWWNNVFPQIDSLIRNDIIHIYALVDENASPTEINTFLKQLKDNYGVVVLPYITPEIMNGNYLFVPIAEELLYYVERDDQIYVRYKSTLSSITTQADREKKRAEMILEILSNNSDKLQNIEEIINEFEVDQDE